MPHPRIIRPADAEPAETGAAIFGLTNLIWPPAAGEKRSLDAALAGWAGRGAVHVVVEEFPGAVRAHARIFPRTIITARGPLLIGALAGVCVHPDFRGRGWGADVARAALGCMAEFGAEIALFQTDVPQFYEKLGARRINNFLFDGTRQDGVRENPFWAAHAMIHPATCDWPAGDIDLGGAGF